MVVGVAAFSGDEGVVLSTSDGGASWEQLDTGTDASFSDVHFFTPENGLIAGWGKVLFTDNGATLGRHERMM